MKTKYLLRAMAASCGLFTVVYPSLGQTWTQTSAPLTNWTSVACSTDGSKLVAVIDGGGIYTSPDSGTTWMESSAPNANWSSAASSADGSQLVAAVKDGPIYASTNSGATWMATGAPMMHWSSVAASADGTRLVAAVGGIYPDSTPGPIFISRDSAATWAATSAEIGSWNSVAASADGNKVVAVSQSFRIATSVDSGDIWTTSFGGHYPISVASSADGAKLVLTGFDPFHGFPCLGGAIFTSTNSGVTWEQRPAGTLGHGSVASSSDGTRLVAASGIGSRCSGGGMITSTDSGATWAAASAPMTSWSSVASSADGSKLVAAVDGGGIWTSHSTPVPRLSLTPAGGSLVLSWIVPSMPFVLQENSDLSTTNWTDVPTPPTQNLTNLQNQVTVPLPTANRFYRLQH